MQQAEGNRHWHHLLVCQRMKGQRDCVDELLLLQNLLFHIA
jgi:hypothetical protein